MKPEQFFIIDFDSTFTQVEGLDYLAEFALKDHPGGAESLQAIKDITNQGMDGSLSFSESLKRRVDLLKANKRHLKPLIEFLKGQVSESIKRNREFFQQNADNVFIVSSGFKDFILPIVTDYGIKEENVLANTFTYDDEGNITGFDTTNLLSQDGGKVKQLQSMTIKDRDVYVIGDGYTDYEMRASGLANKFYAFTENVEREKVLEKADHIAPSFDEVLYTLGLNTAISYPKNRISALLLENVHPDAAEKMRKEGYKVETHPAAMSEEELIERIKDVSIIGIRSKTNITPKVLAHAKRLIAVGAFCIGTNQIALEECAKRGIAVFNAPFSNTRSVVELAIGEMILLTRNLPDKMNAMHDGRWEKSASGAHEIRGKKLGIIGYGNIGAQLSVLAENMGLDVYYYDMVEKLALGNATKCDSLEELLGLADIVTLHIDGRPENTNIFGEREFNLMKDGAIFMNLARGKVVDIDALAAAIDSGKVGGCAVDVFPTEPKSNQEPFVSKLQGKPNTMLTPHIGGSTAEAQQNIGNFVPNKIIEYINTGSTTNSVTFPNLQLPKLENAHRLIHVHHNVPGILAKINQTLAEHNTNIMGQYLKTNEQIGYVITDIDKVYAEDAIKDLKAIEGTIRFRILY